MQNITPQLAVGAQVIESYGSGGFTIAGQRYAHSVLVTPQHTIAWNVTRVEAITIESLAPIMNAETEVILIGTGSKHEMVAPQLKAALKTRGIACDTMDTGAAARTFNVLLSESRRVAVALILPAAG